MLNINDGWSYSSGINSAGKAFIERWIELFYHLTIDNYRVKHLNVRVGFQELGQVVEDSDANLIDSSNIEYVSLEVLHLLKVDPIAKKLLPHHEHYYPSLLSPFNTPSKSAHPGLKVLVAQANKVLADNYRHALIQALTDSIGRDEIDKTLMLTSLLASDLIDSGYDFRYLRSKGFSFIKRPRKAFVEQLNEWFQQLRTPHVQKFLVAYRIDFATERDAMECPTHIAALNIRSQSDVGQDDASLRAHIAGPNVRLATCVIEASDLFAASRKGSTQFYRALDLMQFAKPSLQIVSHKMAYVVSGRMRAQSVDMPLELLGPIRIAEEEINQRISQVSTIVNRIRDASTVHRISLGLQYLRRGITDSAPQGQFLNYWIGLEAIAGGKERTDIRNIRKVVPSLLALGLPRRIIRDLYENFVRLGVDLADVISPVATDLHGHLGKVEAFWRALCDQRLKGQLVTLANHSPLLSSRTEAIASQYATASSVKEAMEVHNQDIEWHIQRLYRVRNAIVHGGQEPTDLTHLAAHIATYLWAILRSMLDDLASGSDRNDINKFFDKHLWIYKTVIRQAESQDSKLPPFALLLEPTMVWPHAEQ